MLIYSEVVILVMAKPMFTNSLLCVILTVTTLIRNLMCEGSYKANVVEKKQFCMAFTNVIYYFNTEFILIDC